MLKYFRIDKKGEMGEKCEVQTTNAKNTDRDKIMRMNEMRKKRGCE